MKVALLRPLRFSGVLLLAGVFGCADNNLSMSILQMEAVLAPTCVATAVMGSGTPGRGRGLLDLAQVTTSGYIGTPVVRNDLMARNVGVGSIELNSIQVTGANVTLQIPASAAADIPASERSFFYASAAGRIDPGGTVPMFIEVLPARLAKQLAPAIPTGSLLTVVAEIRPVGVMGSSQVVGGPIYFPIDVCSNCLVTNRACPFPKGTTVSIAGCFPQQDDIIQCCTETTGVVLCGAQAPIAM